MQWSPGRWEPEALQHGPRAHPTGSWGAARATHAMLVLSCGSGICGRLRLITQDVEGDRALLHPQVNSFMKVVKDRNNWKDGFVPERLMMPRVSSGNFSSFKQRACSSQQPRQVRLTPVYSEGSRTSQQTVTADAASENS